MKYLFESLFLQCLVPLLDCKLHEGSDFVYFVHCYETVGSKNSIWRMVWLVKLFLNEWVKNEWVNARIQHHAFSSSHMPGIVLGARDPPVCKTWSLPSKSSDHICVNSLILPGCFFLRPRIHALLINYLTIWGPSLLYNSPDGGFTRQDYLGVIFS